MDPLKWTVANKEWLFSGVGVLAISAGYYLVRSLFAPKPVRQSARMTGSSAPRDVGHTREDDMPTHWQGIIPDESRYRITMGQSDSVPLGTQTFSFEYGPRGHAKALNLLGRTAIEADVQFSCRIVNPYKALFNSEEYALNVLQPRFLVIARDILEKHSLSQLRSSRAKVSEEIIAKLSPEFEELGVRLETVSIGALDKPTSGPARAI